MTISTSLGSTFSIWSCHAAMKSRRSVERTTYAPLTRVLRRGISQAAPRNLATSSRQTARFAGLTSGGAGSPSAPRVARDYKADGRVDPTRYFAHLAFNPKPWVMWNARTVRWAEEIFAVVDWLVERGNVAASDVPYPLRRRWFPLYRILIPLAPWVWRAMKVSRRLFR